VAAAARVAPVVWAAWVVLAAYPGAKWYLSSRSDALGKVDGL